MRGKKGKLQDEEIYIPTALRATLGFITAYNTPPPPLPLPHRNNLYANRVLHMVGAVCGSAGVIFYSVSEFCGSQMFFNL